MPQAANNKYAADLPLRVSVSLWGHEPCYTEGCIENCRLSQVLFPGALFIVYHDTTVPNAILAELNHLGAILRPMPLHRGSSGMFWRYLEMFEEGATHVIFRDTDSRLSKRDKELVDEWMRLGTALHIIRDHPKHTATIMGGLFGVNALLVRDSISRFRQWRQRFRYGDDQALLNYVYYRNSKYTRTIHTSGCIFEGEVVTPIISPRVGGEYLGGVIGRSIEGKYVLRDGQLQSSLFVLKQRNRLLLWAYLFLRYKILPLMYIRY